MSCEIPHQVLEYIQLVESDQPRACPEQHALAAMIRRIFREEDIRVDLELAEKYLGLEKYFPFRLLPWERFVEVLWNCTFRADGQPRFKTVVVFVGRGAGKDGLIGFDSLCMLSPFNPVEGYNVDICANNEDQAMTPVEDLVSVLEHPKWEKKLGKHFYHTKERVRGRKRKATLRGRTNNPKGRDGMRSGKIIFNEVHAYENYANIKVFVTGQGKMAQPRVGYFSSNGDVDDGPYDDYLARCRRILFEGEDDRGLLPFVCCLKDKDQVHDRENWFMANPSLQYFPHLLREVEDEYHDWLDNPEQNGDFLTKRMGIRSGFQEISVTDYEKVKATKKPLPDLSGWSCTVGVDYAELSDWASVNLHFRRGDNRYDINHAWVCTKSKTLHRVRAPWRDWADQGHVTVVDDVSIHPKLLAEYVREAGRKYNLRVLVMDHFRWTLVSEAFRAIGFDAADKDRVKLIRPSDIMRTDPVIQECFDRELFHWGDNPALRWGVNNTKRVRSSRKQGSDTGNFYYAKIEAKSRKTDMFMALVASVSQESVLGTGEPVALPVVGAFGF